MAMAVGCGWLTAANVVVFFALKRCGRAVVRSGELDAEEVELERSCNKWIFVDGRQMDKGITAKRREKARANVANISENYQLPGSQKFAMDSR